MYNLTFLSFFLFSYLTSFSSKLSLLIPSIWERLSSTDVYNEIEAEHVSFIANYGKVKSTESEGKICVSKSHEEQQKSKLPFWYKGLLKEM